MYGTAFFHRPRKNRLTAFDVTRQFFLFWQVRLASCTAHALRNENKEHGEETGRQNSLRVKIFSEMASQRPGEWVQSLLARFDAQVNDRFTGFICFPSSPIELRERVLRHGQIYE